MWVGRLPYWELRGVHAHAGGRNIRPRTHPCVVLSSPWPGWRSTAPLIASTVVRTGILAHLPVSCASIPHSIVVRTPGLHPGDLGSIPSEGESFASLHRLLHPGAEIWTELTQGSHSPFGAETYGGVCVRPLSDCALYVSCAFHLQ